MTDGTCFGEHGGVTRLTGGSECEGMASCISEVCVAEGASVNCGTGVTSQFFLYSKIYGMTPSTGVQDNFTPRVTMSSSVVYHTPSQRIAAV